LCDRYNIQPGSFYNWKKKLFEGALETFKSQPNHKNKRQTDKLQQQLRDRDSLISTIVAENIRLKKNFTGEI
jgi:transposase-like protein